MQAVGRGGSWLLGQLGPSLPDHPHRGRSPRLATMGLGNWPGGRTGNWPPSLARLARAHVCGRAPTKSRENGEGGRRGERLTTCNGGRKSSGPWAAIGRRRLVAVINRGRPLGTRVARCARATTHLTPRTREGLGRDCGRQHWTWTYTVPSARSVCRLRAPTVRPAATRAIAIGYTLATGP